MHPPRIGYSRPTRPAGTALRVLRFSGYRIRPASIGRNEIELLKCTELDDRAVVSPDYFETTGQFVDGTCAGRAPDHEAYCRGAEITDNQGKILHKRSPPAGARLLLTGGWMREVAIELIAENTIAGTGDRLHFGNGLGSLRSRAWHRSSCGCKDAGNCCRCGNFTESFSPGGSEWGWDGSGKGGRVQTSCSGGTAGGSGGQDDGAGASEQR